MSAAAPSVASDAALAMEALRVALVDPVAALVEPEKRVFWPHLVASTLIVAFVWSRGSRRTSLVRALFSPRLWLHRSALEDYALFVLRGLLRVTLFAPFAIATIPLAARVAAQLAGALGPSPVAGAAPGVVLAVFTATLFVVEDFSRFLFHYASHRVGWLWELHRVHHGAEVLTPFTLYRVHPVEGLLNRVRGALTLACVAGAFAWLFPGRVRGAEILGVDAIGFLWSFAGSNLRHSHVWLSYGARVERWLLSPAQHQVHHSVERRHHDRNFGTALAIWDRLFGTLYVPQGRERITVGLPGEPVRGSLFALVVVPLARALARLVPVRVRSRHVSASASVGSPAE